MAKRLNGFSKRRLLKMNEKPKPSEFRIQVRTADFEEYQNEKSKEDLPGFYIFEAALITVSGSPVPLHHVHLRIVNEATEKYEPKEELIEVGIIVAQLNYLTPFLNEEAIKEIEEGRGIEFIGFISSTPEVVGMTLARIKFVPVELPERLN